MTVDKSNIVVELIQNTKWSRFMYTFTFIWQGTLMMTKHECDDNCYGSVIII